VAEVTNRYSVGRMRLKREPVARVDLRVGDRVRFRDETYRVWWTVRAVSPDGRWAILTKPDNLRHSVLYTIVDFDDGVRGPDNYGGLGYETPEQIADAMERFVTGDAEVSVRYDVPLHIVEVRRP
jgi:hypothetical protein